MSINFYTNVLQEELAKELYVDSMTTLRSSLPIWRSNFAWGEEVIQDSNTVLIRDFTAPQAAKVLTPLFEKGIITHKTWKVMNYIWLPQSYIPWHTDSEYTEAITIYLNPEWNVNFGGIYLYSDQKSPHINGWIPAFNTAVKNDSSVLHSTSLLSAAAYPRVTLQLFSKTK